MLEVRNLTHEYRRGHRVVRALSEVSLSVPRGSAVGLVGESGSGKSTLAKCVMGMERPASGSITYEGQDLTRPSRQARNRLHREIPMVFQDPYTSLNPKMTVRDSIAEGLQIHHLVSGKRELAQEVARLMRLVGLDPDSMGRLPASFSGGQRQRIAIARALAVRPKLLVCDEPVSALDVSVRSQVINLLSDLQQELDLTLLFIAHDLAIVQSLCDRVAVIYGGQIVEEGVSREVLRSPRAEYTRDLLDAVPRVRRGSCQT